MTDIHNYIDIEMGTMQADISMRVGGNITANNNVKLIAPPTRTTVRQGELRHLACSGGCWVESLAMDSPGL